MAGQSNPMADTARKDYTIVTFMAHQLIFPQREKESGKLAMSSTSLLVPHNSFLPILCSNFFSAETPKAFFPNMHCLVTCFKKKRRK